MKWEIQKKLLAASKGLNEIEFNIKQREKISQNLILGPYLKKLLEYNKTA